MTVIRSQSAFGAFYRRKRIYLGPQQALVATAHKIARTVYQLMKAHVPYEEVGASAYEAQQRERDLSLLQKKASKLGYVLVAPEPT